MKRVLLADDSVAARKSIQQILEMAGIEVIAVGNGDLALARLEETAPDMVLLDVHMPGRSGYEVCADIKARPAYNRMPVLLVTSDFEAYDAHEGARVGADGHLVTPLDAHAMHQMREVWERFTPGEAELLAPPVGEPTSQFDTVITPIPVEDEAADSTAVPQRLSSDHPTYEAYAKVAATSYGSRTQETEALGPDGSLPTRAGSFAVSTMELRAVEGQCLNCSAQLEVGDIFCLVCGAPAFVSREEAEEIARLEAEEIARLEAEELARQQAEAAVPRCSECDADIVPGDIFCVVCGAVV